MFMSLSTFALDGLAFRLSSCLPVEGTGTHFPHATASRIPGSHAGIGQQAAVIKPLPDVCAVSEHIWGRSKIGHWNERSRRFSPSAAFNRLYRLP
jgi:hypothetical protein